MSDGQNVEHLIEEARKLPDGEYNRLITELLRDPKRLEDLLEFLRQFHPELKLTGLYRALAYLNEDGPSLDVADRHRITELRGLGKEIWQAEDAQGYVDAERESWNS